MDDKYLNYSLTDLLLDKDFRKWVKYPTPVSNELWEDLAKQSPEKEELIAEARLLILAYKVEEKVFAEEAITQALQKLKRGQLSVSKQVIIGYRQWYSVAASIVLLMVIGGVIWYNYFKFAPIIYQTKYGQMQSIVLPDNSKVTLNANSRLEINSAWSEEGNREVNLIGEAFFEVEKKPATKQKFIVHTEDIDVVVLGTSFNVSNRSIKTSVVLSEGSVRLAIKADENKPVNDLVMQVGDLVEFSKQDKKLNKRSVNPVYYSSWKDNKLIFNDTSMSEIASLIQENYGLEVYFQDKEIAKRKITGTVPSENLEILLTSLETIFNVKITKKQGKLIFEK